MQEMRVWSLDQEDTLEKEMATHSSIIAWKIKSLVGYSPWWVSKSRTWLNTHACKHMVQCFLSVQFSHSVVSDCLQPLGQHHTRLPCPSPTPDACSNSSPSSQWCHPTISSSVFPFSSHLQSFPASESFPMSQFFASVAKVLELQLQHLSFNEYSGLLSFRIDWLDLLAVQGTPKSLLQHHSSKASILQHSAFFIVQISHPYMTTGKNIALTRWTFVGKAMSLLLNMLSRLDIAFPPRSKKLLISWLQSPFVVILEPPKIKPTTVSPSICHEVMGPDAMILVFWMLSFKLAFSLSPLIPLLFLP